MAKRYDNLFPNLIRFDNLWQAYRKAARGKRGKPPVAAFELDLEANLFALQSDLADYSYRPRDYYSFHIRDPKHRLVSAAPFRDRIVHHALCNVIEPLFERTFIGDSYANRLGKGTHRALYRAQQFARRYPYVLQCDVREFFPSIDHACLRSILGRKIADPAVLSLTGAILDNGAEVLREEYRMVYFPGDDLFAAERPRGLPIGNLTSQFWANVYLNELDQLVKRVLRCPAYVRYVQTRVAEEGFATANGRQSLPGGYLVRLPGEQEWERAARGTDGREFPWAGEFDYARANVAKEIGGGMKTTAICTYPGGESSEGAWDMAGNVFEWTGSFWSEDEPNRVVRGGSWDVSQRVARGAYRGRLQPVNFGNDLGFRVVLSLAHSDF